MNRRGFLSGILALSAAPAIVSAGTLMRIQPEKIILWGDGVHDDTEALQAALDGNRFVFEVRTGLYVERRADVMRLIGGTYMFTSPLHVGRTRGGLIELRNLTLLSRCNAYVGFKS